MNVKISNKIIIKFFINLLCTPWSYKRDYWKSLSDFPSLSESPLPWMNYLVIDHVTKLIRPGFTIFEYGSGSSTLYWISQNCKVISVEHDRPFFEALSKKINGKCDYFLVEPTPLKAEDEYNPSSPDLFQSMDKDWKNVSFKDYVTSIDRYENNFFDMVTIDGRARPSCIKYAISKLKAGGVLLLDNSDRDYYQTETSAWLANWSSKTFKGAVRGSLQLGQTTIFIKP